MSVVLSVDNLGQTVAVDLADVTGLDALVFRRDVGEDLDARLGAMIGRAAASEASAQDWPLADCAVLVWLWTRHNIDRDARLADVAATVRLFDVTPSVPDGAEGVSAPEAG